MGEKGKGNSLSIDFLVIDIPLSYNIIMGRPTLKKGKAAISTYQLLMQFETNDKKVGKIQGDKQTARECYVNSVKIKNDVQKDSKKRKREEGQPSSSLGVYVTENPKQYERPQPAEEDEEVMVGVKPGRTVRVGKAMDPQTRLTDYEDVFAYEATEMPGLDPKVICHELNIREGFRPIKQKLRHQGPERNAAAAAEVQKFTQSWVHSVMPVLIMANQCSASQKIEWGHSECVWTSQI